MVTAFAPASVSNLNCGFDVLGFPIQQPGDEVSVSFNDTQELRITSIKGDGRKLPLIVSKNTAGVAVQSLLAHLGEQRGIDLSIHKKMPFGSGLGSSAASAVAAVVATNQLLGRPLAKKDLIPFAMDGEAIASGSRHGDNVIPSLLGGIVLIRSYEPLDVIELPTPTLYCTVIHPKVEILTKEARDILPKKVPLKDVVKQTANIAGLIAGLYQKNIPLISRSLVDVLVEPHRSTLIPEFGRVKNAALYGGALGFGISGSGPSMFALSDGLAKAKQIGTLMEKALVSKGIDCTLYSSKVNEVGAYIL